MLKFIIISILVIYLVFRVIGFFFKLFFGPIYQQQRQASGGGQHYTTQRRKAPNSNLNIDHKPSENSVKSKKDFKGGDYVDFEEVK